MRLVIGLLAFSTLFALLGPLLEGRDRAAERAVRGYLDAIQARDVNGALEALEPSARADWRIFTQHQAGDGFRVLGFAVQRTPIVSGPPRWGVARSITLTAEIDGKGGERWLASSHVRVRQDGDRWYVDRPPFGPDEPWLVPPES